jgi:hypothetical protein
MSSDFDPNLHLRAPVADVPTAYALGSAVLTAIPREADRESLVRKAGRVLRVKLGILRDEWSAASKTAGGEAVRSFDSAADASWRAMSWALEACSLVRGTPEDDDRADRAKALHLRMFPNGLAFTLMAYASQWATAERMLTEIDPATERELATLIGPHYLAFARRAHEAYGKALGITQAGEDAGAGVRDPLRAVLLAIQEYVFALYATYPPSDIDNHPLLKKALAPLEAHRAAQPAKQEDKEPVTDPGLPPVEPLPQV